MRNSCSQSLDVIETGPWPLLTRVVSSVEVVSSRYAKYEHKFVYVAMKWLVGLSRRSELSLVLLHIAFQDLTQCHSGVLARS